MWLIIYMSFLIIFYIISINMFDIIAIIINIDWYCWNPYIQSIPLRRYTQPAKQPTKETKQWRWLCSICSYSLSYLSSSLLIWWLGYCPSVVNNLKARKAMLIHTELFLVKKAKYTNATKGNSTLIVWEVRYI